MEKNYSVQELFFSWHNPKEKDESEVCVHDEAAAVQRRPTWFLVFNLRKRMFRNVTLDKFRANFNKSFDVDWQKTLPDFQYFFCLLKKIYLQEI